MFNHKYPIGSIVIFKDNGCCACDGIKANWIGIIKKHKWYGYDVLTKKPAIFGNTYVTAHNNNCFLYLPCFKDTINVDTFKFRDLDRLI